MALKEICFWGNYLSWGWLEREGLVQCWLDRSFGNSEWFALFPWMKKEYLNLYLSDHLPIRICFNECLQSKKKKKKRICFAHKVFGSHNSRLLFAKWMIKRKGFENIVRQSLKVWVSIQRIQVIRWWELLVSSEGLKDGRSKLISIRRIRLIDWRFY